MLAELLVISKLDWGKLCFQAYSNFIGRFRFLGAIVKAFLNSLLCGLLQHSSLLHQNVWAKKGIERVQQDGNHILLYLFLLFRGEFTIFWACPKENLDQMILPFPIILRDHLYGIMCYLRKEFFVIISTNLPQTTIPFLEQFFTKTSVRYKWLIILYF